MNALTFFASLQALGALIGVAAAVWAQIAYLRALSDGVVSYAERAHLRAIGVGLRFGLLTVLLSSLGLVILAYADRAQLQPALTTSYWVLVGLAALVIVLSWALARKRVPFLLGSAAAFTAWWFLAYLTLGLLPVSSFGSAVALYVIAVAVLYAVISYARMRIDPRAYTRLS